MEARVRYNVCLEMNGFFLGMSDKLMSCDSLPFPVCPSGGGDKDD